VYETYSQHSELNRLVGAVAVSKRFRQALFQDPLRVLERGCCGYRFDLTAQEAGAVTEAAATRDVRRFSLRLWEWMGGDGHLGEKLPRTVSLFENVFFGARPSTVPASFEEEGQKPVYRLFASQPASTPSNRRKVMEPLILIVEDNREICMGLQFALEMQGYRVGCVPDVESALNFLQRERPDLILSDIGFPLGQMDGQAFLRVVKQSVRWRDIPFVFMTGEADWRVAVESKSMGADEYVVKPFRLEDLMGIVKRFTGVSGEAEVGPKGSAQRSSG
jgi:CheY-like chemotaxis protein